MANVLVVDDSKYLRLMIRKVLKKQGHTVVAEAKTGEEAIKAYEEHKPDLVTMDIVMPKMNGLLAIKKLKSIDSESKIIIISALGHEKLIRQGIKLGAADFVIKPFKQQDLVQTVETVLK